MSVEDIITSESKSTDKLKVLMEGISNIPPEKLNNLKRFKLRWNNVPESDDGSYMIVPELEMEFE
jgi:hypothetical protein